MTSVIPPELEGPIYNVTEDQINSAIRIVAQMSSDAAEFVEFATMLGIYEPLQTRP